MPCLKRLCDGSVVPQMEPLNKCNNWLGQVKQGATQAAGAVGQGAGAATKPPDVSPGGGAKAEFKSDDKDSKPGAAAE